MPKKISYQTWRAIEDEYRRGVKTLAEISRLYNISVPSISRAAKENMWTRDLNDEIQAKARAIVLSADKSGKGDIGEMTGREAKRVAAVQERHRNLAENLGKSVEQIFGELWESREDPLIKARTAQALTASFKSLVEIERKSYGMDAAESKLAERAKSAGIRIEFVEPLTDDGADGGDDDGQD